MSKFTKKTIYETVSVDFGPENGIHLSFALDIRDGVAIGISGGGIFNRENYIGSFDGLVGFAHNVSGKNKEAVDALLDELSSVLEDEYGIPSSGSEPIEEPTNEEE